MTFASCITRIALCLAVTAMLLPGCATVDNRFGADRVSAADIDGASSIVILSAGADERCTSAATFLKVKPSGVDYEGSRGEIALLAVDAYVMKSDFADHQGNLHVLKLQPGSYYAAPWVANGMLAAKRVPKAEFTVKAGEIVYLGEYYMPLACAWETVSEFRDQESRDLALLAQKNPGLAARPVVKRIAAFTGLAVRE